MSGKNVIIERITTLKNTSNLANWSENLISFFEAYRSHKNLAPAFEAIHKKKTNDFKPFFQAYQAFNNELSQLFKMLRDFDNSLPIPWQLVNELPSNKQLIDPFFTPEAQFFENCKTIRHFFEKLFLSNQQLSSNIIPLLTKYLDISTHIVYKQSIPEKSLKVPIQESFLCRKHLNFDGEIVCHLYEPILTLTFKSPLFYKLNTGAETLAYSQDAALWKKLDNLDKWVTWTARGIHPENLTHKHNLFNSLQLDEAIKSLVDYLLDYLMKDEELSLSAKPLELPHIRSLSIFPYKSSSLGSYAFWIVSSHPNGSITPYYVRKVDDGSETYKFIETLLQLKSGDAIELEDESSPRAELSLTKEIKKIFFYKKGKKTFFRGFSVFLNELDENLDLIKLQEQLNRLNQQQDIPKFPQNAYLAFLKNPTFSDV